VASVRLLCLVKAGLPTSTFIPANAPSHQTPTTYQGEIIQLAVKMKTRNYSEHTIRRYTQILTTLAKRGADLYNPTSVMETIASQSNWTDSTKHGGVNAATLFLKQHGIETTQLPKYKTQEKIPFIPTENEIDQLISGCKHQLATFMQTLKETGARSGEAISLKWTDHNTETATLTVNDPEKHSNPRQIKISDKLQTMLNALPHTTTKIFNCKDQKQIRANFQRARKRISKNLGNPRILQIHFHTFRHWKATTEYHKTNNLVLVMKILGHKSLSNTQKYIQLLPDLADDFVCETARNVQEAMKLIETGFEYITEMDGLRLFRKRK